MMYNRPMIRPRLRIAFFGNDFSRHGKGTALVVQRLVDEIVARYSDEAEVILLRPYGKCSGAACDRVKHVLIKRRFSTLFSYLWFFLTHRARYDIVVFNNVVYPGFFFLRAEKFILLKYDAAVSEAYTVPRTFANRAFEMFLTLIGQHFLNSIVAVSNDAREWIIRYHGIAREKMVVMNCGTDDEYVPQEINERAGNRIEMEKTYGISSPYILDVARFDPHKNIERVLDAFFLLKKTGGFPHSLVLVGGDHTPDYSAKIREKIRASEHGNAVRIVSYVDAADMVALYNCADVLVCASLVEGFGLPVVEAMKCGTPVVASNISCLPEVAGGAAVLVDPKDADAIAGGIVSILRDEELRKSLVAKGLERAKDFTWQKSADTFMQIVRS